ncbi:hypothetical protein D0T51_11285 [Parabacteroides sp. 52]|uniref:hypothetical protein n=1 Tax=unclassified Parabacteroides TaxID=2649774 RepID=UPI0013D5BBAD|nr:MULTISPECIES: hypothetical protein [unclassified Parabacteroides]MDH6535203.1 hypothetical protein [Parabacteroides sp. PM5-20]NDV56309.1 hypothetical protein [Parabacteroides sp. 52]
MKNFSKFWLILFIVGLCSCNSYKGMQGPSSRVDFNKNDFNFSEQVSAKATTVRIFGIDWASIFNTKTGNFSNSIISSFSFPLIDKTANKAIYKVLEQNPNYDVVFFPSIETKRKGIPFIFTKKEAIVKTKLAKIKE